jgi:hypothetical protein
VFQQEPASIEIVPEEALWLQNGATKKGYQRIPTKVDSEASEAQKQL